MINWIFLRNRWRHIIVIIVWWFFTWFLYRMSGGSRFILSMFHTDTAIIKTTAARQLFQYVDRLPHRCHSFWAAYFLILDLSILGISHHFAIGIYVCITVTTQVIHESELAYHGFAGRDSAHRHLERRFERVLLGHPQNLVVDKVGKFISEKCAIDENIVVLE